jgi:iron complex outermembrane receptor protein
VKRDVTQLSGSVSFDLSGGGATGALTTPADVRLSSPLYDRTLLNVFSQELRLASTSSGRIDWLAGVFYQHSSRTYGQDLPTPGYDAFSIRLGYPTSVGFGAAPDTPFYSNLHYNFRQFALFGESTWHLTERASITSGLRVYKFDEVRDQYFGGLFGCTPPCTVNQASVSSNGASPRVIWTYKLDQDITINTQASRGFRLGGINDPLNAALCKGTDKFVFGGHPNWKDETAWNYEVGAKSQWLDRKVTFNASAFFSRQGPGETRPSPPRSVADCGSRR